MFGLSWDQIVLVLLAALFLLGPERIPTAIKWIMDSLRKLRTFAAGAQSEMRSQLGPELDELRRQIAELQSLKEVKELKELRDLDPRRMVGKSLLGDEFSGGIKGFLGLTGDGLTVPATGGAVASAGVTAAPAADVATSAPAAALSVPEVVTAAPVAETPVDQAADLATSEAARDEAARVSAAEAAAAAASDAHARQAQAASAAETTRTASVPQGVDVPAASVAAWADDAT